MQRNDQDPVWRQVSQRAAVFCDLSDRVWEVPETNFREKHAAEAHRQVLEAEGFRVTKGIAGMPTALLAEAGSGGPVIAFLGEYDALPGLSQQAGTAERVEVEPGGHGHGCGHNLLGAGAALAAAALKAWLEESGLPGTVRYFGCPAEEGGSGKAFLVRAGLFDGVDAAFCWHPAPVPAVNPAISLACSELTSTFLGRSSHAAATPELGRSALDAVELMNVGVNYLREHMPSSARVHYAITDAGGPAPNVVQARAQVRYMVRTRELDELLPLVERVKNVARGAALMTETEVTAKVVAGDANLIGNRVLEELMQEKLEQLGPPEFAPEDYAFAEEIRATLRPEDIQSALRRFGVPEQKDKSLGDFIVPLGRIDGSSVGSTDVGTVSWVVPTVQMRGATYAIGTPGHSWQLVAQGKSGIAHKGMEHCAKVLAATARALIERPDLLAAAKAAFAAELAGRTFTHPLPDDVPPDLPQD